jgi:hypothetical protein
VNSCETARSLAQVAYEIGAREEIVEARFFEVRVEKQIRIELRQPVSFKRRAR